MNERAKPAAAQPRRRDAWVAPLLPVLAALAIHANTMPGDFVFDDAIIVQSDPGVREFDLERIFRRNYWGTSRRSPNWRPLALLSFAANHRISSEPWSFHAVNWIANAAATLTVYLLMREVLASRWLASGGAALFAALPIHTEAVANIVGRAELLAAIFLFLAWWLGIRSARSPAWWTAPATGAAVLMGLLCKENVVVAAGLIPLSAWMLGRRIPWAATGGAISGAALYGLLRWLLLDDAGAVLPSVLRIDNPLASAGAAARAIHAIGLLGLYGLRTVFPFHLSADHSFNQLPVHPLASFLPWMAAAATLAGLLGPAAALRRRLPAAALGFLAFPVAFLTTANIFFPIGTIFAERLAYAPSAGLALAAAAAIGRWIPPSSGRHAAPAVFAALVLACGARSFARNRDWGDAARFDIRLAEDAPGSTRAHQKAAEGHVLLARRATSASERRERLEEAEREIARAIEIDPSNASPRAFRALICMESERFADALAALDDAAAASAREGIEPDPDALYLRAEILSNLGQAAEALQALDVYIARRGRMAKAFNLRGVARMSLGDLAGAREDLDLAIELDPRNARSRMNRGIVHAQAGRADEARADLDTAVRLAPGDPQVYINRGLPALHGPRRGRRRRRLPRGARHSRGERPDRVARVRERARLPPADLRGAHPFGRTRRSPARTRSDPRDSPRCRSGRGARHRGEPRRGGARDAFPALIFSPRGARCSPRPG